MGSRQTRSYRHCIFTVCSFRKSLKYGFVSRSEIENIFRITLVARSRFSLETQTSLVVVFRILHVSITIQNNGNKDKDICEYLKELCAGSSNSHKLSQLFLQPSYFYQLFSPVWFLKKFVIFLNI